MIELISILVNQSFFEILHLFDTWRIWCIAFVWYILFSFHVTLIIQCYRQESFQSLPLFCFYLIAKRCAGTWLFNHSHLKWPDSLEIQVVCIEICMLSWNLVNDPKHQKSFFKYMACSKGSRLLACYFLAVLDQVQDHMLEVINRWIQLWITQHQGCFTKRL